MNKLLLGAFLLTSFSAFAFCENDAKESAKSYVAKKLDIKEETLNAVVLEDHFNETYGEGSYLVEVSNESETLKVELVVEMVAFSNSDDTEITCEADEGYIP